MVPDHRDCGRYRSLSKVMGSSRTRIPAKRSVDDGRTRYTAYFCDLKGRERSAGTYSSKREADRAWQDAEAELRKGRVGDPARGRQTFRNYVEDSWLPNHQVEPSTREGYTYSILRHLMPEFGPMRMVDILPEHVRAWVTHMKEGGVTPATIRSNRIILSAIFTTALEDQVTFLDPCKGVRIPTVPKRPLQIITPEQFELIYEVLLVETEIESGLRWGELSDLRVKDLDRWRMLTVSRAVVELNPKYHPTDGRFHVKDYPNDLELSRGLYQLAESAGAGHVDFVAVSGRAPHGMICLNSALAYWDLSDEIPPKLRPACPASPRSGARCRAGRPAVPRNQAGRPAN